MSFLVRRAALIVVGVSMVCGCSAPGEPLIDGRVVPGLLVDAGSGPAPAQRPALKGAGILRGPLLASSLDGAPVGGPHLVLVAGPGLDAARARPQGDDLVEVINVEGPVINSFVMPAYEDSDNEVTILIGPSWWDELPDQQPNITFPTSAGFGSQEEYGIAAGVSYRRRVADADWFSLWLGVDLAFMSHAEDHDYQVVLPDGEVVDDDVTADVTYGTLAARVDVPIGPVFLFVGGGAGLYYLSFDEEDSYYSSDEIVDDSEFAGYVQLGLDCPLGDNWSVRVEDRVHFVQFDGLNGFTPGNDSLSGPIHTFLLGIGFRF